MSPTLGKGGMVASRRHLKEGIRSHGSTYTVRNHVWRFQSLSPFPPLRGCYPQAFLKDQQWDSWSRESLAWEGPVHRQQPGTERTEP